MTVTPPVIKANGLYSFTIDSSTKIPSGGFFTLTFPSEVVLSQKPQCKQIFGFQGGTPTCTASGNVLTYSGGFSTLNGIRFTVSPVVNPGSAQNVQNFIFKFYSTAVSVTPIDSSTATSFFFQYETDTLISAVISPDSWQVGATTSWELSITPKNQVPAGGIVKFFMPKWNIPSLHSISAQSMLASGSNICNAKVNGASSWMSVSCQFVVDSAPANKDTLIVTGAFSASTADSFDIQIKNVRNMPTTRPYSAFEVWTYDGNQFGIDNMKNMEISMSQPGILPSSLVSVIIDAPSTVDAVTSYLFTLFIQNPLPMGGKIRVRIPSSVGPQYLTSVKAEQRMNSNVKVKAVDASDTYYVELYDGYPTVSESVPIAGLIAFRLQYLKNPSTSTPTASFEIETYDSDYIIEKITTGLIVIGATGKIKMNTFSFSESRVLEYNAFNFDMTLANALTAGSTIEIKFPTEFIMNDVPAGSCRLIGSSGLDSSASCTIVSNKLVIQNPFGSTLSAGGERIKFTVANNYIQNPTSTRPLNTFITVKSLTPNGNTIDDITISQRITLTENTLSSVSVTPSTLVAGDFLVTYTFRIRTPYLVEQNAQIYIKFPTGDTYIYDTSTAAEKCFALATLSQTNMKCSTKTSEVTITRAFPSGTCACQSEIALSVGGIINPRSFMPSGTFQVLIMTSDNYIIYSKRSGITVTMTSVNSLTTATVSLQNGQNGAKDNYIFSVKNHNQKQDGDYLVVQAPNEITFSNQTLCAARSGVRGFTKCLFERPNKMTIAFVFAGRRVLGEAAINKGFEFMLTNIVNPPSMAPSGQFQISSFTAENYNISKIINGPTVVTTKASNMSQVLIKPSIYSDGKWTNLTFSVIPNNYIQFMTMTIQVPQDVLIAQAVPNLCQVISTYSISKEMVCDYVAQTRTIRILNAFQVLTKPQYDASSIILKQLQFMIGQFINPVAVKQSGDFVFTTYDKAGYIVDQQKSSISYICSPLCGTCSSDDYTKCTSCNNATQYRYLFFGQCVQSCPDGTTISNNKCLTCPSGCESCSSVNDTCEACSKGLFFIEGACIANCPKGYIEEPPAKCIKPEVPVYQFTSYFQKTEDYQCYMFPFSAASVAVSLILWIATCCSKRLMEKERQIIIERNQRAHEVPFLNPLRLVEVCIALISLIELAGWVFFLYCMINIKEKLPFYVICGALGFNIFLNFIMTCGIMKSKENYDIYVQKYSKTYNCTYAAIKVFTLFISHKGFYLSFARYYRSRNRQNQLDFSYFDSGDEDGMSGVCFKFFFLTSVLLLHGAVIAACVLNYLSNDLSKKLFCLDLDIIGMTTYQAILVLLTLLQCGRDQSVHPNDDINKEIENAYAAYDEDEEEKPKKMKKQIIKKKVKDKNGKMIEVEEVIEITDPDASKDQKGRPLIKGKPGDKLPARGPGSKNRLIEDDLDNTRNADRTIDPMDYEEDGRQSNRRRPRRDDVDGGFDDRGRPKKKKLMDQGEDDEAEEINAGRRKRKRRQDNEYDQEDFDPEDDSFEEDGSPSPRTKKKRQQRKRQRRRKEKIDMGLDPDEIDDDYDEEDDDFDGEQPSRKPKKKKKKKKVKKTLRDGSVIEETIEETEEDDEDDEINDNQRGKSKKKPKKKKKKVKKVLKDGTVIEESVEDEEDEEEDEEELDDEGQPTGKTIKKPKKKNVKKKKKKKKIVKKTLKDGRVIEEEIEETVEDEDEEEDEDDDDDQNADPSQNNRKKKPKKKKKKKVIKKVVKNGKVIEEEVEETEEEDDEEEDDDDDDPNADPAQKKKKKKPKKKKKKIVKKKLPNGQIVEELESISEEEDDEEDPDDNNQGSPGNNKAGKKGKKRGKTTIERVSHNASSLGDDDIFGEQQAPHFEKVNVDQKMKKFDQQLIADSDEPSYRELVDQINHVTTDNRTNTADQQLIDRSRSPKKGNYLVLNQDSQSKEEILNNLRVSAKYGTIHQSIPTQYDESMVDGRDQVYPDGTQPQFSQEDQILLNQGSSKNQLQKNDSQFSKVIFKDSQAHLQELDDQNDYGPGLLPVGSNSKMKSIKQVSPLKNIGSSELPTENNFDNIKTKEGFKTPTMSMENHAPYELRSNSFTNGAISPGKRLQPTTIMKNNQSNRNNLIEHQESGEVEDEEVKDYVNKDDIKPKTKIIFSDKSESSVEDLMEDTPSNYNVLNGRLDEDSQGLRSIQYKALSKKILYKKNLEKQIQMAAGNEDQEARRISSKGSEVRSASQNPPPQSTSSSSKMRRREKAMLFIKKAENTGMIFNEGNTLLAQQVKITQGINRHYRNASIGEIPSEKLINDNEEDEFKSQRK